MLIVVAVMSFIGIAIFDFSRNTLRSNSVLSGELASEQDTRSAMREFLKESRASAPSEMGAYPVAAAATSSFTFFSDYDSDGVSERVRYFLEGGILKKGIIEPTGSPFTYNTANEVIKQEIRFVVNGTSTNLFNYYDTNYAGTTSPLTTPIDVTQVRLVKMTVLIDAFPTRPPDAMSFTTQVSLRNLKDNL